MFWKTFFFLCLNENLLCWPDVFSTFSFSITNSSECCSCKQRNESETTQLYVEMEVPSNYTDLSTHVEAYFNERSTFGVYCEDGCKAFSRKTKWISLTNSDEIKFLIVILTRGIETLDGYQLVKSKIKSTKDVNIR